MPELTRQQLSALSALDWLFTNEPDERRSGRSMVLAIAFLRQACNLPLDTDLRVFDHYLVNDMANSARVRDILHSIARIADAAGQGFEGAGAVVELDYSRKSFRLTRLNTAARRYIFEGFTEVEPIEPRVVGLSRWERLRIVPDLDPM
jgi:hypothetical protein